VKVMKKLLIVLSLVVISFVTVSSNAGLLSALAQENNPNPETPQATPEGPPIMQLPSMIDCSHPRTIESIVVGQFKERPLVNANTVIKRPDGVIMPAGMTLYVNIETGTYSLVAKFKDIGFWCIINSGGNFQPARDGQAVKEST
jgi:hypothetical protein